MLRALAPFVATTGILAGCGGGGDDDRLTREALRDCLAEGGLAVEQEGAAVRAGLGNVSPDFRVTTKEGVAVDVVVLGSARKARRSAADVRGALRGFGAEGREVVSERNAIVVFGSKASQEARRTIDDCLAR